LTKQSAKHPVTAHDVRQVGSEQLIYQIAHQAVAKAVQGALVLGNILSGAMAITDHHVSLADDDWGQQFMHLCGGVSQISVSKDIDVRVDIEKCTPDGVTLAWSLFINDPSLAFQAG
jgi:hypothetical protein